MELEREKDSFSARHVVLYLVCIVSIEYFQQKLYKGVVSLLRSSTQAKAHTSRPLQTISDT